MQVYVEVLDENDNTPLTELPVYYPSVPENSPAGVSVLQIRAFDRDASPQRFVFSISSGNPEGYFLINSTTGKFRARARGAAYRVGEIIRPRGKEGEKERKTEDQDDGSLAAPAPVMRSILPDESFNRSVTRNREIGFFREKSFSRV